MKQKIAGLMALLLVTLPVWAQETPESTRQLPPTIADVVLLLKSYEPDMGKIAGLRAEFNKPVPETGDAVDLAQMWHRKAIVADELGETQARYDLLNKALAYAEKNPFSSPVSDIGSLKRVRQDLAFATPGAVGFGAGVDAFEKFLADFNARDAGTSLNVRATLSSAYLDLGDLERAQKALTEAERTASQLRSTPASANYASTWMTHVETARGKLQLAMGKHEDAGRSFLAAERMSQQMIRDAERNRAAGRFGMPQDRAERLRDSVKLSLATVYLGQQRYNDAELLLREILKSTLTREGRNTTLTGGILAVLGRVHAERGRNSEALALAQWADRAMEEAGVNNNSPSRITVLRGLADQYAINGRYAEAIRIYDDLQKVAAANARYGADIAVATLDMVRAYAGAGRAADALASGDRLLATSVRSYGASHYKTAEARGYRAMALQRVGRLDEARKEFEGAIAILLEPDKSLGGNESSATRSLRMRAILDGYLEVLVGPGAQRTPGDLAEAFRVADVVRWQSVQKAVSGSALRAAAGTPELGAKIKTMQDNEDELQAVYKNLIAQRSAPPEKQLPAVIAAMEKRIATLHKEQEQALTDIRRQFPKYDALVNPRPADLATARGALQPNEALLSIYVTEAGTYVWAAGSAPDAGLQFHFSPRPRAWLAEQVKRLRDAVDLTTGVSPDRMKFDLEAAYAIYRELLEPVQAAWAQSDTLLVVANDALGQIPFSMLVTAATPVAKAEAGLPLSQYRQAPWLARKVAISYLPSVNALVTLRAVASSRAQRAPFIGFGDPDFGKHATQVAAVSRGTRNLKINHAPRWDEASQQNTDSTPATADSWTEVPELSPLPDTRDEIVAIATALSADPAKDTFFGLQATPQSVTSADLKGRRIVAFATHGLVAGDLPGLDQPALALSPLPGKDIYSGLLKLDDVLKLSLDADLVVLSACNTAAADGSGSEAVSGLGRGFFYAGSRSVLATHWPVETVSARQLVTHLFERYSQDTAMTRAKALQRAMLQVLDKEVAKNGQGAIVNAYAHPAFWAPYALYGDPGR